MRQKIYIIGHKSPDTDSVTATLVFSDYLKKQGMDARPALAGKLNKETEYVLCLLKIKAPQILLSAGSKRFFLVDHGDLGQAVSGIKNSQVFAVLDHHKMSGLITDEPIFYYTKPVGSSCTIVFCLSQKKGIRLTKKQATLLLAGIISDTLKFNSPTTTSEDKKAAKELAQIAGIKINEFAGKMFEAKSDISNMKTRDLLLADYKLFDFYGKKVGIGVHETTNPYGIRDRKQEIFEELKKMKNKNKVSFIFWAIVDIIKNESFLFLISPKEAEIAKKAFKGELKEENIMFLKGITSRKKQIVPPLAKILSVKK